MVFIQQTQYKTLEKLPYIDYNGCSSNPACQERSTSKNMTGRQNHRVSASLQVEDGKYIVRARVFDPIAGKVRQRSRATGLAVKGNKRRAEEMMKGFVADWQREANAEVVRANPMFSESVSLWFAHKQLTLRESTITAYEHNIKKYILPRLGKLRTREMSMYQIRAFYDTLLKTLSVKTVRKIHVIVFGVLADAVSAGIRQDNPAASINLPKAKKFEGKAYTEEQVAQLLDAAKQEGEPLLAAITLGVGYGLRRSEICGLRWSDIDFDAGTMHICNTVVENCGQIWEQEATKTAKSNRMLSLGSHFNTYLKALRDTQTASGIALDKVCCWPDGRPVQPSWLSHMQSNFLKRHGLEHIRLHDLRHTAASMLAKRATLNQVRDFLGHEDISTTYGIYVHTDEKSRAETAAIMDGIFESVEKCSEKCSETV